MPSFRVKTVDLAALSDEALRDLFVNGGSVRSIRSEIRSLLDQGITEVVATSEAIHLSSSALPVTLALQASV